MATIAGTSDRALIAAVDIILTAKRDNLRQFQIFGEYRSYRVHVGNNMLAGQRYKGDAFNTFIKHR